MKCKICKDSGWVCEDHPEEEFEHIMRWIGFRISTCKGSGMPCKCNTYNPPWDFPDATRIEVK